MKLKYKFKPNNPFFLKQVHIFKTWNTMEEKKKGVEG